MMGESSRISSSSNGLTSLNGSNVIAVGGGVLGILSAFTLRADICEPMETPRKETIRKIQIEMSTKASELVKSKIPNLPPLTQIGQKEIYTNLEQWKWRYYGSLDSNLKLIQQSRLPMIPEELRKKIVQTALMNIHRILEAATLDLANSQMRICGNPDTWAIDPTVKLKACKPTNPKS